MNPKRGLNTLTFLIVLSISNADMLICEFKGTIDNIGEMAKLRCEILGYSNVIPTASGVFGYSDPGIEDATITKLKTFNCLKTKSKVFLGLKVCKDNDYQTFDSSISDDAYLRSAESAIRFAKSSGYEGFYVTLCDSTDSNYKRVVPNLLARVKQIANEVGLPYGIRVFGQPDYFPFNDHKDSADFLAISVRNLFAGGNYSSTQYSSAISAATVCSFWSSKVPVGKLAFSFNLLLKTVVDRRVVPKTPAMICSTAPGTNIQTDIDNLINQIVGEVLDNNVNNMLVTPLDYDDFANVCGRNRFPMMSKIQSAFL